MEISKTIDGADMAIKVMGRLETATAPDLDVVVKAIPQEVKNLKVDFSELECVSSAGLRVILTAQKTMIARQGAMALSGVNDTVKRVFDITGFSPVLTFV